MCDLKRETRTKRAILALGLSSALLLPVGCASSSRNADHITLLHNELRLLEDVVYELEGEVKDKEQQVNAAKRENELYKEEIKALNEQRQRAAREAELDVLPPAPGSLPRRTPPKPDDMGPIVEPKVEAPPVPLLNQGGAADRASPVRQAQYTEAEHNQLVQGPALANQDANDVTPQRNLLENHWKAATVAPPSAVDHITIHPRLSGGHDSDKRPGHDGLQVVFAPRDAQDQPLQVRGAISVVLVDPQLKARSARWEYSVDEAQQFFKKSMMGGEAYHLDLRWPLNPPTNADQELHVRFTTADGQRHEASTKIILQLPGSKIAAPPQVPTRHAGGPQQQAPRSSGSPTLAPPQYLANDPPPAWNGQTNSVPSAGPNLNPPQITASQNYVPPPSGEALNNQNSINITVPDVPVPSIGQDNQRLTIAQRLQQRRAARLRTPSTPSLEETGNIALPNVEAPALPGMSTPNISVPNLNVPGSVPSQPAPAKTSGWRSWFSKTPEPATTAPAYGAPAYGAPATSAIPAPRPEGFTIIPAPSSVSPGTIAPGVTPLMAPPPQLAAPQYPDSDASRTAKKPEWKPFR